jgi:hypothetical protein
MYVAYKTGLESAVLIPVLTCFHRHVSESWSLRVLGKPLGGA